MQIDSLLPFVREIDRLKTVERQTLIHGGGRRENTAEHSWHLAMAALVFHPFAEPGLDLFKAMKMALTHDLVEIDAGDTFVYGDLSQKEAKERAAIERLTELLPGGQGGELKDLWLEFEEGRSPEARYVSALDRFLPLYSNHLNHGYSWVRHGVSVEQVEAKTKGPIIGALPELWKLAEKMVQEAAAAGQLKRSR